MPLKILFHRASPIVRVMEILGVFFSCVSFWRHREAFDLRMFFFVAFFLQYVFIRACDWVPWYPLSERPGGKDQKIGIEVHLQKSLVPASYMLAIVAFLQVWPIPFLSCFLTITAFLLATTLSTVNGILIFFHWRDKDPLPINFFSNNRYLREKQEL